MYRYLYKLIDWGVKFASLAVTGPATWLVATELFADIRSPLLFLLIRAAAVFLVEGVLLSNWLLLEFDKQAAPEIKARYGLTALAMYVALLVIAWKHEGPTGLVFRLALLAALLGSGWDTYVYTWRKATASVDRSAENSGQVRRHARKLAIRDAMSENELRFQVQALERETRCAQATLETQQLRERLQVAAQLKHKGEMQQLREQARQLSDTAQYRNLSEGREHSNWGVAPEQARAAKQLRKARRLELGRSILQQQPDLTGRQFLDALAAALRAEFGARAGISESTAYADFAAIRSELAGLPRNGNGRG